MTDRVKVSAEDLVGKRLLRVTTSWHRYGDEDRSLLHLWLHLEGLGPVQCHTPGTGLSLRTDRPHEPYSMGEYGSVLVETDTPETPLTRYLGEPIGTVREIRYDDGRVRFPAGLALCFPEGTIRLLALDDELIVVETVLPEDTALVRVVETSAEFPAQWDAWTADGRYLYLRYRHGEGIVEEHPGEDTDTWDGEASGLLSRWDDGTGGGRIGLGEFLTLAGLHLAPDAEVRSAGPAVRFRPGGGTTRNGR
ncbi:hypothetical protein ACWDR0_17220 [Streptomyces sp. NPDC003691]